MMLRGGHPALFLRVLFAAWVLSPFAALVLADVASKRWLAPTRATLYGLMLVVALGSLAVYGGLVPLPESKPAFLYLVVPAVSWLLLAIALPAATFVSRTR